MSTEFMGTLYPSTFCFSLKNLGRKATISSSVCFIFSDRILCFVCLSGFHRTEHSLRGQSEKHLREEQFTRAWIPM